MKVRLKKLKDQTIVVTGASSGMRTRNQNALDRPSEHLSERDDYPGHAAKTSLYTAEPRCIRC